MDFAIQTRYIRVIQHTSCTHRHILGSSFLSLVLLLCQHILWPSFCLWAWSRHCWIRSRRIASHRLNHHLGPASVAHNVCRTVRECELKGCTTGSTCDLVHHRTIRLIVLVHVGSTGPRATGPGPALAEETLVLLATRSLIESVSPATAANTLDPVRPTAPRPSLSVCALVGWLEPLCVWCLLSWCWVGSCDGIIDVAGGCRHG